MLLQLSGLHGQQIAAVSPFGLFLMCSFILCATPALCCAIMQAVRLKKGREVTEQEAVSREGKKKKSKRKPQVGGTTAK